MFTFCPLQGALSESTVSQSLLELDGGIKVLIDVGWDESFDVDKLKELEKYALNNPHKPYVGRFVLTKNTPDRSPLYHSSS